MPTIPRNVRKLLEWLRGGPVLGQTERSKLARELFALARVDKAQAA